MPWYLRKSVRMGPVRWNLSKSGIGMSVGVRGLRVGTGPRGTYVAGGRGPLRFRQSLGASRPTRGTTRKLAPPRTVVPTGPSYVMPQPSMAPVEVLPDTNLDAYTPASSDALATYIVTQLSHTPLLGLALVGMCIIDLVALAAFWPIATVTIALTVVGAIYLARWDRQRTHVSLSYTLDQAERARYDQLCGALQAFTRVQRVVRVESRQVHGDWKNQAGASVSLMTQPVSFLFAGRPTWLETDVPVLGIQWRQGNLSLVFLPDRALVVQGHKAMVLRYRELSISTTVGRFVEKAGVPADAQVVGMNWQHPNKNGGPDKRYANNRQWPVINVAYITLTSAAGLNLTLQASNVPAAQALVHALQTYQPLAYPEQAAPLPPQAVPAALPPADAGPWSSMPER